MDKIIKEFFKSDKDEAEFFGVSRKNSMTLGEYQNEMKELDRKFQIRAQFEINSIKRKCNWVDEVWFYAMEDLQKHNLFFPTIYLYDKKGREIYAYSSKLDGNYEADEVPKIYQLTSAGKLDALRRQDIGKIKQELTEIGNIAEGVYKYKLHGENSVSDNFNAIYRPESGLYVFTSNSENISAHLKPNRKNYDKPLIKDNNNGKVLKKILIKNN